MLKLTHEYFMQQALQLAAKAVGLASPNPMVGCVIISNDQVIARGYHKRYGEKHAEINALKQLKKIPYNAVMYVTLEPCFHQGKTPPCVDKIIESGVRTVVVAMKDPNPLTNGKSIVKMRKAGVKVVLGVLKGQAEILNEAFLKHIRTGFPFVVAKSAQTLDGKIATRTGDSQWITSSQTREYARRLRGEFDAIMVGITTVLKDNPSLGWRNKDKRMKKIVLDSSLKIPLTAKVFKKISTNDCIIATTKRASRSKRIALERKGIHYIVCPEKNGRVDMKWFFKELGRQGIISILIEGGAKVVGSALKAGLVDKMHIYIAPKLLGDQNAKSSIAGLDITRVGKAIELKKITTENVGKDILVKGYVFRNH